MNKTLVSLSSISMDLERVAMGYQRGSAKMADRFLEEALTRRNEINEKKMKPNIKRLINGLDELIGEKDSQKKAEDALMYSILFQNAVIVSL